MTDARLQAYLGLLFRWNPGAHLTAFRDPKEAAARGVEPSLAALPLLPEAGAVLDVGSGGGFPAVPLALARPDLRFTLCEPAPKKAAFLREAARALSLPLEVEERSAQELLGEGAGPFAAATARGVRLRRPLVKKILGAVIPGGRLLVWTGGETLPVYRGLLAAAGFEALEERPLAEGSTLLSGAVPRGTTFSGSPG